MAVSKLRKYRMEYKGRVERRNGREKRTTIKRKRIQSIKPLLNGPGDFILNCLFPKKDSCFCGGEGRLGLTDLGKGRHAGSFSGRCVVRRKILRA